MKVPENPMCTEIGLAISARYRKIFELSEPITLDDGSETSFVCTSWGLETILGEDNAFAVFPCDKDGVILDWGGVFSDGEGPSWAAALAAI